ncbi:hypothetical protein BGW39_003776 [Mortierella sp. 14UC]|nr:hypothetical protein BGW39_003776 [Mortierella sp. 14UC]
MQLTPEDANKNPLDLPEIRDRISLFLERKDCLSCMRVSRDWFKEFVKRVWCRIDFAKDSKFNNIDPKTLDKYGSLIKLALKISTFEHILSLQHPQVNSVELVSVLLFGNWHYRELFSHFVRRCGGEIRNMTIHCTVPYLDNVDEQRIRACQFVHVNTLLTCPMPKRSSTLGCGLSLECLELSRTCLTREGFSALLQYSPVLRKLKLFRVVVLRYNPAFELFRDSRITSLEAPLGEILIPDNALPSSPSLLVHLPLLKEWHVTSLDRTDAWTDDSFRSEMSTHCPLLKSFQFDHFNSTKLSDLLLNCAQDLESCTFPACNLYISTVFACVSHQRTLTSITLMDKFQRQDSPEMQWAYFLPKLCFNLKALSMEGLILDMKSVENQPWTCLGLQELRVQFRGLDSNDGIEQCVKQVCAWRQSGDSTLVRTMDKDTILSKVSLHLVQFKQLSTLWAGTKERNPGQRP